MNIIDIIKNYVYGSTSKEDLIREEAKIGGQLFGQVPPNKRRSFFCLDENTWVWHEDTVNKFGDTETMTVRYEILKDKIIKVINGKRYLLSRGELINFYHAITSYRKRVFSELYNV